MSIVTRPVHHREVMGSFSGGTFTSRGTRDGVRPKPAPIRQRQRQVDEAALARAIKDGVAKGFAGAEVVTARTKATTDAASAAITRLSDSMDRLKGAVETYAQARRLRAGAAQAVAARDAAIAARSSPATVQAANAARWPRPGR